MYLRTTVGLFTLEHLRLFPRKHTCRLINQHNVTSHILTRKCHDRCWILDSSFAFFFRCLHHVPYNHLLSHLLNEPKLNALFVSQRFYIAHSWFALYFNGCSDITKEKSIGFAQTLLLNQRCCQNCWLNTLTSYAVTFNCDCHFKASYSRPLFHLVRSKLSECRVFSV